MSIPIGIEGRVLNAELPGTRVRVEADTANTDGYLIYQWSDGSKGPNPNGAFDDWVASLEQLEEYFSVAGWVIEWA